MIISRLVLLILILWFRLSLSEPTQTTDRSEAKQLNQMVQKLREYVQTVLEELQRYEDQLTQKSDGPDDSEDPEGMVVVAEETEEPAAGTESSDLEQKLEECHCDCDKQGGNAELAKDRSHSTKNGKRDIAGSKSDDNVALILKTIRDLLKEANLHRLV